MSSETFPTNLSDQASVSATDSGASPSAHLPVVGRFPAAAAPTDSDASADQGGRDYDHLWSEFQHAVAEIKMLREALHIALECDWAAEHPQVLAALRKS